MAANRAQTVNFVRTVARLARLGDVRIVPLPAMQLVKVMRLNALFAQADRDALDEMAVRLQSVSAAVASIDFLNTIAAVWPEPFVVHRHCCQKLTHDEHTIALLAQSAARGSRAEFSAILDGFVRASRHEKLFDVTVSAVAALSPHRGP